MLDLFRTLYTGTKDYTISHIDGKIAQKAYREEAERILRDSMHVSSLNILQGILEDDKDITKVVYDALWNPFTGKKYALLAYDQAIEVVESLRLRFKKDR